MRFLYFVTHILGVSCGLFLMSCQSVVQSTVRQTAGTTVQKIPLMPAQYSAEKRYALNLKTDSKITAELRTLSFQERLKLEDKNPALLTHGHYYCDRETSPVRYREQENYYSKLLKIKNPFAYLEDQYNSQVQELVEKENQLAYKALACGKESRDILQGLLNKANEKVMTYDKDQRLISVMSYEGLAFKNISTAAVDAEGKFEFSKTEDQDTTIKNIVATDERDQASYKFMPLKGSTLVGFLNTGSFFRFGKTLMEFYVVKFEEDLTQKKTDNLAALINQKLSDGAYTDEYDALVPVGMVQNYNNEVIALNYVGEDQINVGKLYYNQTEQQLMLTKLLSAGRNHQIKKMMFNSQGILGVLLRNEEESTVYFWNMKNELLASKTFASTNTILNLENDLFTVQDVDYFKDSAQYVFNVITKAFDPVNTVRGDDRDYKIQKLQYTTAEGDQYPLLVVQPTESEPEFILLKAYGGFFLEAFDPIGFEMRYLVSRKGLVAQAFVRGDSDLGYDDWFKGLKTGKRNAIQDVVAAAEKLKKMYPQLKDKIFFEGWSNGGMLALNTVLENPELFAGVIAGSPNTDLVQHERLNAQRWSFEYGEMSDLNLLFELSPYYRAMKTRSKLPPILLRAAYDDLNVSPVNSFKMIAALKNYHTGGPFYLITRPFGEGHNLRTPRAKVEEYSYIYSFIFNTLPKRYGHTF